MGFFKLIGIGLVMGVTVVIPGLSAGTMAIVFNVYDRLIGIIVPNVKTVLAAWKFWLPLAIGGVAGIFSFVIAISVLFEHYEVPTMMFFIGLIAGGLPLIYRRVWTHNVVPSLFSFAPAICMVLAFVAMIVMAIFTPERGTVAYTDFTLQLFGILALAGVLSGMALILPGISGAFVLLVMGLYLTVIQAAHPATLNIPILLPFFLGVVVGIFLGASLVRFLLKKAPRETYGAVLGLVAGSIFVLFPNDGFGDGMVIVYSIIALLVGTTISFFATVSRDANV